MEETERMDTGTANSSQSTVEAVKFQHVHQTHISSGMDLVTKATLKPMHIALVYLASASCACQGTGCQGGRQPPVSTTMMQSLHWTKQLPGSWCLDAASVRWKAAC